MLFCLILTMKRFHNMNAYYERDDDKKCVRIYSYRTYMGGIYDDGTHCVRDYVGATTQKQMTRFFKEFCGIKTANAYKKARAFYRKCKKDYKYKLDCFYTFDDVHCTVYENGEIVNGIYF